MFQSLKVKNLIQSCIFLWTLEAVLRWAPVMYVWSQAMYVWIQRVRPQNEQVNPRKLALSWWLSKDRWFLILKRKAVWSYLKVPKPLQVKTFQITWKTFDYAPMLKGNHFINVSVRLWYVNQTRCIAVTVVFLFFFLMYYSVKSLQLIALENKVSTDFVQSCLCCYLCSLKLYL